MFGFVLFFYKRSSYDSQTRKANVDGSVVNTAFELPDNSLPFEDRINDGEDWQPLIGSSDSSITKVSFQNTIEGRNFVHDQLERGEYFMSGALDSTMPNTPPPEPSPGVENVRDYISPFVAGESSDQSENEMSSASTRIEEDLPTVLSDDIVPGKDAIAEQVRVCEISERVSIASSKLVINLALSAARGDAPVSKWSSVVQGHPGNVRMVKVEGESWRDYVSEDLVEHMAVSDGISVFDKITNPPPDGIYVTSDEMRIYTGAAIKDSIASVAADTYSCPVVCVNGVAGSGKSYYIVHHASAGDVVLCETKESLSDVARDLHNVPGWRGHAYTVDSYLMHRPVKSAAVLWIDEAFRLHAGKIFSVMKMLRPAKIYCFGDDKQIPVLPFVPGYDFEYHEFPFISVELKKESYRCPADVCFVLSSARYYEFQMTTHNPILRSLHGPVQFVSGMFQTKKRSVPLLVYTQSCKADLVKQGITSVLTIGEAQGKTYGEVILFRDSSLPKANYTNSFQTLVALTRHRKKFTYVTVDTVMNDRSGVASLLQYAQLKGSELLYSAHLCTGVKGAADAAALENRRAGTSGRARSDSPASVEGDHLSDIQDWSEVMEEFEEGL